MMSPGGARPRGAASRRAGSRAIVFWALALVAGAAAAALFKWYVDRRQPAPPPLAQIVVAAADLSVATAIAAEQVRLADWPVNALPSGAIRDPKAVIGKTVTGKVLAGEPLLEAKLAEKGSGGGLAALVPRDMRALAVRVDDVVGVAGFIHPDDRVDVIVTMRARATDSEPVSKLVLQNIRVLAVGRQIEVAERNRGQAIPVTVATLLVTPEEAEKLAYSQAQGRLLLVLRNSSDDARVETPGAHSASLLREGERRPRVTDEDRRARVARVSRRDEPPAAPAAPAPEPPQNDVVEILRGDRFEQRKFDKEKR